MADPLIEAVGVTRAFGAGDSRVVAVQQANCRIQPGDKIALVGPSGSGKSTLLHLLAGLDQPSSGTVRWPGLGDNPETLRPTKISFVFQAESLLAPLTVIENIEVPCLLNGSDAEEARNDAKEILGALELAAIAEKLPEEISGGQAQRAAVARSLITHPAVILADEPTGQLDHATARHLLDLLDRRLQNSNTALVIATHDAFVASRMKVQWRMEHGTLSDAQ
ncbi:MAG TPA: ATP-binding cassette domain-containing protein [Gemmatimonadaceae bacterium]|nr:ATP-binding cassette domain-containing protein [Gemmatimonadaceae bacterium]